MPAPPTRAEMDAALIEEYEANVLWHSLNVKPSLFQRAVAAAKEAVDEAWMISNLALALIKDPVYGV